MVERSPDASGPSAVMQIEQLGEFGEGSIAGNNPEPSSDFIGKGVETIPLGSTAS
ncbi:MAG: hypothetical protein HYT37_01290 [Candidatus Sungbacteria bacterium]|nr:hypothetical protein [Candidatus Sungbacteria bacterium]